MDDNTLRDITIVVVVLLMIYWPLPFLGKPDADESDNDGPQDIA